MDIYSSVQIPAQKLLATSEEAVDYANAHGIVIRNRDNNKLQNHAPFTLFPSPYPSYLYDEAWQVQKDYQTLVYRASRDSSFIFECLENVCEHDDFTKRQMDIYKTLIAEGSQEKFHFNITRSDYMVESCEPEERSNGHADGSGQRTYENRQIEINMMCASFAGLDTKVTSMHKYMADAMGELCPYVKEKIPANDAVTGIGEGIANAWTAYGKDSAVVIFVVLDVENNRYDQRCLEYAFHQATRSFGVKHHVPVLFRSLDFIHQRGQLDAHKNLVVEGKEVAVCYFRAGYTPTCYSTEDAWSARLMMERSNAIKCPNIAGQLIGTKKVQQVFAKPGMVERFMEDPEAVKRIRNTFAGLYSLDPGSEGDEAVAEALKHPSKYVLKPQREGGGNNMYDDEMVDKLKTMTDPLERSQYILMERVQAPIIKNYIVHIDFPAPQRSDVVTELGIYGYFLSDGREELENRAVGYLVRSKSIEHSDGGVCSGRAVLDSAYLI